jgi:opacity protein-like surface antigen
VGLSIIGDSTVTEFVGLIDEGELTFDPGFATSIGVGYEFNRFLAVEFETGFLINDIDELGGMSYSGDAVLYQTPVMGNVIIQFRNETGLVPFGGAGVGGSLQVFTADDLLTPAVYLDGSDTDFVFAWQVFGGLKYEFNENMGAGITYRYLSSDAPRWDASGFFLDPHIAFERIETHSITGQFHYRF